MDKEIERRGSNADEAARMVGGYDVEKEGDGRDRMGGV